MYLTLKHASVSRHTKHESSAKLYSLICQALHQQSLQRHTQAHLIHSIRLYNKRKAKFDL